jgi:hypothetical protein
MPVVSFHSQEGAVLGATKIPLSFGFFSLFLRGSFVSHFKKLKGVPGVVVYICNHSYSGGRSGTITV